MLGTGHNLSVGHKMEYRPHLLKKSNELRHFLGGSDNFIPLCRIQNKSRCCKPLIVLLLVKNLFVVGFRVVYSIVWLGDLRITINHLIILDPREGISHIYLLILGGIATTLLDVRGVSVGVSGAVTLSNHV